jgi:hypothetical protein
MGATGRPLFVAEFARIQTNPYPSSRGAPAAWRTILLDMWAPAIIVAQSHFTRKAKSETSAETLLSFGSLYA